VDVTRTSAVTPTFNAVCQSATLTLTDASVGNSIDFTVDRVRPGCQVTLTYALSLFSLLCSLHSPTFRSFFT